VAFTIFEENIFAFGRDRDLILYDRLLNKELLVILDASFTGLWKDIKTLELNK
jgi:hypothetical protein